MAKTQKPQENPVHIGRTSWWDGKIITRCGRKLEAGTKPEKWTSYSSSEVCRDCKAGRHHQH